MHAVGYFRLPAIRHFRVCALLLLDLVVVLLRNVFALIVCPSPSCLRLLCFRNTGNLAATKQLKKRAAACHYDDVDKMRIRAAFSELTMAG